MSDTKSWIWAWALVATEVIVLCAVGLALHAVLDVRIEPAEAIAILALFHVTRLRMSLRSNPVAQP